MANGDFAEPARCSVRLPGDSWKHGRVDVGSVRDVAGHVKPALDVSLRPLPPSEHLSNTVASSVVRSLDQLCGLDRVTTLGRVLVVSYKHG